MFLFRDLPKQFTHAGLKRKIYYLDNNTSFQSSPFFGHASIFLYSNPKSALNIILEIQGILLRYKLNIYEGGNLLSHKDETTREVSASELGQFKDKYSQLEDNFSELKRQALLNETQGLVPAQGDQTQQQLQNIVQLEQNRMAGQSQTS